MSFQYIATPRQQRIVSPPTLFAPLFQPDFLLPRRHKWPWDAGAPPACFVPDSLFRGMQTRAPCKYRVSGCGRTRKKAEWTRFFKIHFAREIEESETVNLGQTIQHQRRKIIVELMLSSYRILAVLRTLLATPCRKQSIALNLADLTALKRGRREGSHLISQRLVRPRR